MVPEPLEKAADAGRLASRFPAASAISFLLIILVAALTWIIPAGKYARAMSEDVSGEITITGIFQTVDPNPQGFGAAMPATIARFYDYDSYAANAINVSLFVLFLGVVKAAGAMAPGFEVQWCSGRAEKYA